MNIFRRICELWRKVKEYLRNLNIFPSVPPSTDEYELESQRTSTRLFMVIFLASITNLLVYNALIKVTKSVTVEEPTSIEYAYLNSKYSQTLTCPCRKISISFENFLHVDYTLHQVCNSFFVNQTWMEYLRSYSSVTGDWEKTKFQSVGQYAFQALRTICDLIKDTISDQLIHFYSNQYVTASVVPQELFESETKLLIDQFRSSLTNKFLLSLAMIRDATQVNALVSLLKNNYNVRVNGHGKLIIDPKSYYDCNCMYSFECIYQWTIEHHENSIYGDLFVIPNFYTGCYMIESLFQSTLEWFYHQEWIDALQRLMNSSSQVTVTALNKSLPSTYSIDSTIREIVNNLMIERWNVIQIFENYYNECKPIQCTYTLETNNDIIYIFTSLFGIAGGLTTFLKLIVPRLITLIRKNRRQQQVTTEVTIRSSIYHRFSKLKGYMLTFNLFPSVPPSTDEYDLQTQRISTKLLMIIFSILLSILLLYTSSIRVTKTITVKTPTFMEYEHLNSTYSQTLTCPCSKISVNYGAFLYGNYTLHQVCSSIFVDYLWIRNLTDAYPFTFWENPTRRIVQKEFLALRAFCDLINKTISNRSIGLNSNQYVSASLVSKLLFEAETKSVMDQFRASLTNQFLLFLRTIQETTHANALFSALQNNYFFDANNGRVSTGIESYDGCNCFTSSTCIAPFFINVSRDSLVLNMTIFYTGCNLIESLLQSTLECFYDQQCINDLQRQISLSSPINVTALDGSLRSVYLKNSTIKELLDNLMIEQWKFFSIFENYYNQCHPIKCIYTFETNNDIISTVTTLFGIVGGLITVLKLIVPRSIKRLRRRREQQQQPITEINQERHATRLWGNLKNYLGNVNIFPSVLSSTDENQLRTQRISTRLFIIIFLASIVILLLYTSLIKVTKIGNVETPSFEQYTQLYSIYSQTLKCPCSKVSINYGRFLHVDYTLHQVCSSIFVNQSWINYLYNQIEKQIVAPPGFPITGSLGFQALRAFCNLSDQTINYSLNQFYSDQYISASIIRQQSFQAEINSSIDKFQSSLKSSFSLSLTMIRNTTQASGLFSALQTNCNLNIELNNISVNMIGRKYNKCDCSFSSTCIEESSIFDHNGTRLFNVSGFYTGCFVVESLFQSTLECFYDQKCIENLTSYFSSSSSMNVIALNASSLSKYSIYSNIKNLVDNLMIEQLTVVTIFENYYNECGPIQCTYTFETHNDIVYIFTTLFGIVGGLTTVLKFVVPRFVNIIMYHILKQRIRIVPERSAVEM